MLKAPDGRCAMHELMMSQKSPAYKGWRRYRPSPGIGKTGTLVMKRASQPRCFRSNHPNIRVGRNTTQGRPASTTSSSCAFFVSVYQSTATEFTTEELI